jgi:DNA/RNA-binding domain of Phe-tRNA-synthetase-like protein
MRDDLEAESGWFDHAIATEFPTLAMRYTVIEATNRPSSPGMRGRLADHSTKLTGTRALELPRLPIPSAYRAFFRTIGMDPDVQPTPIEAVARARILHGSFPSRSIVADALIVATLESHVALGVLDADLLDGPLGIRPARHPDPPDFARGTWVIADAEGPVAQLFGAPVPRCSLTVETTRVAILAVGVPGMDPWVLDDALWRVAEMIKAG